MPNEPLLMVDRVREAAAPGESHFREYKSALEHHGAPRPRKPSLICKDIGEALVAFANADGGEILVGVEDDGAITGVQHGGAEIDVIFGAPETHVHSDTPLAGVRRHKVTIDDKLVLYFAVDKGTDQIHLTTDGRCLVRRDLQTIPASVDAITVDRQEATSRRYDRNFVDGASLSDLDGHAVKAVADTIARGMSPEKALQYLGLAEFQEGQLRLRRAALLLFASDVARWHPRCEVRVVRVEGSKLRTGRDYNVLTDDVVRGNVLQLTSQSWELLRPHLTRRRLAGEGVFAQQLIYPEDACREALANALAHRDYSVEGKGIEVLVFEDRIDVISPGALLSTVSVDDLRAGSGAHESRNTSVARVLRELGYMREMGEGIRRIIGLMRSNDLQPPSINTSGSTFSLTLHHRSILSDEDRAWLESFEIDLTRDERLVALLGKSGALISTNAIWETLDLVDTEVYRGIVAGLQLKGILETVVSKTSARGQLKRTDGVSMRDVPRFGIRAPSECVRDYDEVAEGFRALPQAAKLSAEMLRRVFEALSPDNYFTRRRPGSNTVIARALGFIDDAGRPTARLAGLWNDKSQPPRAPSGPGRRTAPDRSKDTGAGDLPRSHQRPPALFAGNLPFDASADDVRRLFEPFGRLASVAVPRHPAGGIRGYAFVEFEDGAIAHGVLRESLQLNGREVKLDWAQNTRPAR